MPPRQLQEWLPLGPVLRGTEAIDRMIRPLDHDHEGIEVDGMDHPLERGCGGGPPVGLAGLRPVGGVQQGSELVGVGGKGVVGAVDVLAEIGRNPLSAMPQVSCTAGLAPAPHGARETPPTDR